MGGAQCQFGDCEEAEEPVFLSNHEFWYPCYPDRSLVTKLIPLRGRYYYLTFLGGAETVISRHILYVVHQCRVREQGLVLVDSVHGVLEGQLSATVLLVFGEYGPCNYTTITWNSEHSKEIAENIGKLKKKILWFLKIVGWRKLWGPDSNSGGLLFEFWPRNWYVFYWFIYSRYINYVP
jgi:hypothetical protein